MSRKQLPPRMATKWKLIPTPRYKKCANTDTLCGVYIGNGSRICPKCKMQQPPPKKRKRKDNNAERKKLKIEEVFSIGEYAGVYWTDDTLLMCKIIKISKDKKHCHVRFCLSEPQKCYWQSVYDGEEIDWTWNGYYDNTYWVYKVEMTKLRKPTNVFRDNMTISTKDFKDMLKKFLKNFQEKKWNEMRDSYPTYILSDIVSHDGQRELISLGDLNIDITKLYDPGFHSPEDENILEGFYEILQEQTTTLQKKYFGDVIKHKKTCHNCFKGLRVGNIIKFIDSLNFGNKQIGEIQEMISCFDNENSKVKVKFGHDTNEKTIYFTPPGKHSYFPWIKYQFFYEEMGSPRPYDFDTCVTLNKKLINIIHETPLDDRTAKTFDINIPASFNKFHYNIHISVTRKVNGYSFKGSYQLNIETDRQRRVTIHHVKLPKLKVIDDYKEDIIRMVGKHDWEWLNPDDASKEIDVVHPLTLRFLGCNKFKTPFANLPERKKFYDNFNIETSIQRRFHGTHSRNLFNILHPLGGFANAETANGKCYGHGIYFAKSPRWVYGNGYAPQGVANLRCVIVANIICGKQLQRSTDSHHTNASLIRSTSSIKYNESSDRSDGCILDTANFELTGGCATRDIDVVWYDRCKTDINITHVLWYK